MGREKSVLNSITGVPTTNTTLYDYDLSGKLISTTYPDNYHVAYNFYPGTGLLHTVAGITDIVSYATCTDYEPTGKIGKIEHGNGTATRYTYDPLSTKLFGILTQDPSWASENDLQRRQYSYPTAGDIKEIIDDLKGITYTYTYDKLHRLISETNTGDYNPAENPETNRYTYIYSNNHINAVNQISLNGTDYYYTYDDNGNMNSGPDFTDPVQIASRVMEFNADNMPIRIEHAIGEDVLSTGIIYDGDSVRAKKTIYEEIQLRKKVKVREWNTTYYIGKHFEVADGNAVRYIFAGNLRIAKVADSDTHYFHKDHIGSSVAMTDENGTAVETSEYMPFGHERDHTGIDVTDYKFTDQELDTESGLNNYDARL